MPENYWFASILIDPDGHWRGRFLRSRSPATSRDPGIRWLLSELADAPSGGSAANPCFIPRAVLEDPIPAAVIPWSVPGESDAECVWLDRTDLPEGLRAACIATSAAGSYWQDEPPPGTQRLIRLDTGAQSGWRFSPGAPATSLADLGHLRFVRPAPGSDKDRSKPQLLNLLALVTRDADTREIEKAFRIDPELAYHLLRLVNSVGMGLTHPVRNLNHAITVVGRRQLQRWLQLLIYVNTAAARDRPNPLLQLAAYRGRLLELLTPPSKDPDSAYIVGIFSLLDRVLPQKMSEIVAKLPIQPVIREALCTRGGHLGGLLAACEEAECGRLDAAAGHLEALDVDPQLWMRGQHVAYGWAYALGADPGRPTEP